MDEETHKVWWPLHIRRARKEALTPEEYALYEKVQQQLDAEEEQALSGSVEKFKQAQQATLEVLVENRRLKAQLEKLQAQIALLESRPVSSTNPLLQSEAK